MMTVLGLFLMAFSVVLAGIAVALSMRPPAIAMPKNLFVLIVVFSVVLAAIAVALEVKSV